MKRYPNCVHKLFYEPLLITPSRHAALCKVLEARMAAPMPEPLGDMEPDEDDGELDIRGTTCVIPIHGVITAHASDIPASSCGCGMDVVSAQIKAARASTDIETIVFDCNSPGGGVSLVPETARLINSITDKDTFAYADSECCSAGLWLATQAQHFFCSPSSSVGSIGVWSAYLDISRQMQNEGVSIQTISAGKYKLMGAYWKPLSQDETAILQAGVDSIYKEFCDAVNVNREISSENMQGQIFSGTQACEIGLADGTFDSLDELLDEIASGEFGD